MARQKASTASPSPKKPPALQRSELRKHYFLDEYVIIAPKRNLRPESFKLSLDSHKSPGADCPFCKNEPSIYDLPLEQEKDAIRSVLNAFPALSLDNPRAYGIQEVVIETTKHALEFSELSIEHIRSVLQVFIQRRKALMSCPGIQHVEIFKNDGPKAGASIAHAHSQIAALPLIPPQLSAHSDAAARYEEAHGHCPYCWIAKWESSQSTRIIFEDKHLTAVTPYASSYGFEVWIIPNRHIGSLSEMNLNELSSLAVALKKIAAKLDSINLSFNFTLQESITDKKQHMYLRIEPRYSIWAGLEISSGIIINAISPEYAALWYKDKH